MESNDQKDPVETLEHLAEATARDLSDKWERFNASLVRGFEKLLESPFKKEHSRETAKEDPGRPDEG